MIIVDEFHHAAAKIYQDLLSHYKPEILLGLTATPERMDNLDILGYFDGRIGAEIRLPEAIDRKLLCPFHYFGVTDTVDLDSVSWKCGGYDKNELSKIYTGNTERAGHIAEATRDYVTEISEVIGLGFCVSIAHARFMSEIFNKSGIPSASLHSKSSDEERKSVQKRLTRHEINFIFVVDLYNEGVDIPEINTVLFLRPTESTTVFLQQLGRGLRLYDDKECLTVLDFVGRHNASYRFSEKLAALLSSSDCAIQKQIETDNFSLPKGCHIHLEKIARNKILDNIKSNLTNKGNLVQLIKRFESDSGSPLCFKNFMDYHSIPIVDIYAITTFTELCRQAGICKTQITHKENILLQNTIFRLISINSVDFTRFTLRFLKNSDEILRGPISQSNELKLSMLYYSVYNAPITERYSKKDLFKEILENEWMTEEITGALEYNLQKIDFIEQPLNLDFETPLELHCTYTRAQIFAGLGHYTPDKKPSKGSREGVVYFENKNLDVFFITLNKTEKQFSPSTMYEDYAINERLFHWQSQSTTSEGSETGQRYINHNKRFGKVLLFVRGYKKTGNKTNPYVCLGTAQYVRHTGSRPMNIIWNLDNEMSARTLKSARKMT